MQARVRVAEQGDEWRVRRSRRKPEALPESGLRVFVGFERRPFCQQPAFAQQPAAAGLEPGTEKEAPEVE